MSELRGYASWRFFLKPFPPCVMMIERMVWISASFMRSHSGSVSPRSSSRSGPAFEIRSSRVLVVNPQALHCGVASVAQVSFSCASRQWLSRHAHLITLCNMCEIPSRPLRFD